MKRKHILSPKRPPLNAVDDHLHKNSLIYAFGVAAVVFTAFLASILVYCDGGFYYTLDDPYIHLSLAENLAHGHFGINPGEVASPSSSILWPFLLAIWSWAPWFTLMPLVYNILALGAAVWVITSIFKVQKSLPALFVILMPAVFLLAFNGFELAFTGMEHVLLILLLLVGARDLHRALRKEEVSWLGLTCLALAPLVRYEMLPLSGACFAILLFTKEWRKGLVLTAGMLGGMVAYGLLLHSIGLPAVPSSIMQKFTGSAAAGVDQAFITRIWITLINIFGHSPTRSQSIALYLFGFLAIAQWWTRKNWPRYLVLLPAAAAVAIVFIMPSPSYNGRYVMPALAFMGLLNLMNWNEILSARINKLTLMRKQLALLFFLLAFLSGMPGESWHKSPVRVPLAARSIYKQHAQLHNFIINFYKGTVAAHDIGEMSLRNDYELVDLAGLASERVRTLQREQPDTWITEIVDEKKVGLLIFYDSWEDTSKFPATWRKVAVYKNVEPIWSIGSDTVSIYETPYADDAHVRSSLEEFKKTLPAGIELTIL